ncbi:hypothetical protein AB4144_56305, partial [Rhizobiaceae sp. 2RAB30]
MRIDVRVGYLGRHLAAETQTPRTSGSFSARQAVSVDASMHSYPFMSILCAFTLRIGSPPRA